MSQAPLGKGVRSAIGGMLFVAALIAGAPVSAVDTCPTSASEIDTDRPDVTNSSRVVPYGSLQAENGVDWNVRQESDVVSGTTTRLRLGVAQCTEVLADVPTYFLLAQRPRVIWIFRPHRFYQVRTALSLMNFDDQNR